MFALGYYHQRASDQARMREASDRKRSAQEQGGEDGAATEDGND